MEQSTGSLEDDPVYKKYLEQQRKAENRFGITILTAILPFIIPIVIIGIWEWGKRKLGCK